MSDFKNQKYDNISLVELFVFDNKYYTKLKDKKYVRAEADLFLQNNADELNKQKYTKVEAFRKLAYEDIIDRYSLLEKDERDGDISRQPKQTARRDNAAVQKNNSIKNKLHCINDMTVLKYIGNVYACKNTDDVKYVFPMYECPICKQQYTDVDEFPDLCRIKISERNFVNIKLSNDTERFNKYKRCTHWIKNKEKCYVQEQLSDRKCLICDRKLETLNISIKGKKHKVKNWYVSYCFSCGVYYINYSQYCSSIKCWQVLNPEQVDLIKQKKEKKKNKKAEKITQIKKVPNQTQKQQNQVRKIDHDENKEDNKYQNKKATEVKEKNYNEQHNNRSNNKIEQDITSIQIHDFVVRRSVFRCIHQEHDIQDIKAVMQIADNYGHEREVRLPAGYCPKCKMYFILDKTYETIRRNGTPLCKVCDEKTYLIGNGNTYVNGMQLAQQSILMQYGYNVSQQENLSDARRRKILSLLIDNRILTRNDIMNYLDFFIGQRKNIKTQQHAIRKWESDRDFISSYKGEKVPDVMVGKIKI